MNMQSFSRSCRRLETPLRVNLPQPLVGGVVPLARLASLASLAACPCMNMQVSVASNLEAARTESRRDALVALRYAIDSSKLRAETGWTLAEIAEIDGAAAVKPKGLVDELKSKRDAKGGKPAAHASSNA